ncbi:hypothetical protein IAT38_000167 [Cryptococcus sp. DSM 104549]
MSALQAEQSRGGEVLRTQDPVPGTDCLNLASRILTQSAQSLGSSQASYDSRQLSPQGRRELINSRLPDQTSENIKNLVDMMEEAETDLKMKSWKGKALAEDMGRSEWQNPSVKPHVYNGLANLAATSRPQRSSSYYPTTGGIGEGKLSPDLTMRRSLQAQGHNVGNTGSGNFWGGLGRSASQKWKRMSWKRTPSGNSIPQMPVTPSQQEEEAPPPIEPQTQIVLDAIAQEETATWGEGAPEASEQPARTSTSSDESQPDQSIASQIQVPIVYAPPRINPEYEYYRPAIEASEYLYQLRRTLQSCADAIYPSEQSFATNTHTPNHVISKLKPLPQVVKSRLQLLQDNFHQHQESLPSYQRGQKTEARGLDAQMSIEEWDKTMLQFPDTENRGEVEQYLDWEARDGAKHGWVGWMEWDGPREYGPAGGYPEAGGVGEVSDSASDDGRPVMSPAGEEGEIWAEGRGKAALSGWEGAMSASPSPGGLQKVPTDPWRKSSDEDN